MIKGSRLTAGLVFLSFLLAGSPGSGEDCDGDGVPDAAELAPLRMKLEAPVELDAGFATLGVKLADLTGDGLDDLIAWSRDSAGVAIFTNLGGREFSPPARLALDIVPDGQVLPADIDSDGDLDLCGWGLASPWVTWLRNDGDGTFSAPQFQLFNAGDNVSGLVGGDFDGDGTTDLAALRRQNPNVHIWLQSPRNGTQRETAYLLAQGFPGAIATTGDLNSDGWLDLVVEAVRDSADQLQVLYGKGDGTFGAAVPQEFHGYVPAMAVLDLNRDGKLDLAVLNGGQSQIAMFLGQGAAQLLVAKPISTPYNSGVLAAADLDLDGDDDLLCLPSSDACSNPETTPTVHEAVEGALGQATPLDGLPTHYFKAAVGDLDGDARPDVALATELTGGSWGPKVGVAWNASAQIERDCNRDGLPDDCQLRGNDCDSNGVLDTCDVVNGAADCNQNAIPDRCERDCDQNGKPDDCDIAAGALDLDGDAIPDSCSKIFSDCNRNGLDDIGELATGTASDCNQNGVPDACDVAPQIDFISSANFRFGFGRSPSALASGDFNEDSRPDLVISVAAECCPLPVKPPGLELLLGTATGEFLRAGSVSTTDPVDRMSVGDFNGDGNLDLVAQSASYRCGGAEDFGVTIIPGDGKGGFGKAHWAFALLTSQTVVSGDADGDQDLDLLSLDANGLVLWRNDGRADFIPDRPRAVPPATGAIAILDVDSDGRLDLIAMNYDPAILTVFLGAPEGVRMEPVSLPLPQAHSPNAIDGGDLDGDGDLDLVTGEGETGPGGTFLGVYWQSSRLNFDARTEVQTRNRPYTNFVRDVDGDQDLDLLSTGRETTPFSGSGPGFCTLALNEGAGKPFRPVSSRLTWDPAGAAIGDFGGNPGIELAVLGAYRREVEILRQTGQGVFQAGLDLPAPAGPRDVAAADLNGDARPDLVIAAETSKRIQVAFGSGSGLFHSSAASPTESRPMSVATGDFDGDKDIDVAVAEGFQIEAFLNDGAGALSRKLSLVLGSGPVDIAAADLDGDQDLDLITANTIPTSELPDNVTILENDGHGDFAAPRNLAAGTAQSSLEIADMDADGLLDLVIGSRGATEVFIFRNLGRLGFGPWGQYLPGATQGNTAALPADLDADGDFDLLLARPTEVEILRNLGGVFGAPELLPVDPHQAIAQGDFDGDAAIDIAVTLMEERFAILSNDGLGHFSNAGLGVGAETGGGGSGDSPPQPTALALLASDLDLDGRLDLVQPIFETDTVHVLLNRTLLRWPDADSSGVPDACENPGLQRFRRGDSNADGLVDLSDAITLLRHLFLTGEELPCEKAADTDDDGGLNVTDAIRVLRFLFLGGAPPPAPWVDCGHDLTQDGLDCGSFSPCGE